MNFIMVTGKDVDVAPVVGAGSLVQDFELKASHLISQVSGAMKHHQGGNNTKTKFYDV